jgi:hypothetical protein
MYGLMKIPLPMIPPTTTIVASNGPSARRKDIDERIPELLSEKSGSKHGHQLGEDLT